MTDPYESLANAIVVQAAKDYRKALRDLKRNRNNTAAKRMKEEVERFFHSEWYSELTDLDGAFLMRMIKEEVENDSEGIPEPGVHRRR
jgi:hypothetical protein